MVEYSTVQYSYLRERKYGEWRASNVLALATQTGSYTVDAGGTD